MPNLAYVGGFILYAIHNNEKILASPKKVGLCPGCGGEVVAKCGNVNAWHWAHAVKDCDWDSKPETEWHLSWKKVFPADWCEVNYQNLRADVRFPSGFVIELQNSHISTEDICLREITYGKMIWVINGSNFEDNFSFKRMEGFSNFRWKWKYRSLDEAKRPIYLDFGDYLFQIKKLWPSGYGWGYELTRDEFISFLRKQL
jgi:competence protein CoiA